MRVRFHSQKQTLKAFGNGITGINEAVQNLILNAHALGPTLSYQTMESPRHKVRISENVARMFQNESLAELKRDPGDEILSPLN